jgi:gamma-glutamyl phosphate reductase
LLPNSEICPATEQDWHTEYGDLKITVKIVSDIAEAIEHINHYGSRHTESVLTEDQNAAELFMDEVDAASVFHNASTRFADGFRYGLGAELGISNSKLHARGPVGLEGLLTYKYKLHGSGICHIYVDSAADLTMAKDVIVDAKVQYPAACNSVEKVLVHESVAQEFLPALVGALQSAGVEVRGCSRTIQSLPGRQIVPATEEDWHTEYGDLKVTVKIVSDMNEAIEHINHYGSRHTESILTQDDHTAELFMDEVDAASVFHNASTRFADGFRYGLGAELGISNSKLHARGPVGLEGLLTYKYKLHGSGQTVTDYAQGRRTFKHRRS